MRGHLDSVPASVPAEASQCSSQCPSLKDQPEVPAWREEANHQDNAPRAEAPMATEFTRAQRQGLKGLTCKLVIIRNKDLNSDRVLEQVVHTEWFIKSGP